MANKVTIDVEARFVDNVTSKTKAASNAVEDIGKKAEQSQKKIDNLGKKATTPKLDADDSKILNKLKKTDQKLNKLGRSKTKTVLDAEDKASGRISKILNKVRAFAGKTFKAVASLKDSEAVTKLRNLGSKAKAFAGSTYSALVKIRDSNALSTLNRIGNASRNIAGKTWTAAVKIKDLATSPLRAIKNTLFSVKSLVMAITAGLAAKQLVLNPISLADSYSSAQIGFATLLGESAGQQMMNDLDAFAKATPFKSSQVISQTQRMLAMGWDAESIIGDMTIIGDAAAATGRGEQGLQQIVTALAQIKTKGRLSTEELNQLAEAGISAKRYLAEGLGYGTGDEGIAAMTKDLEDGAIASGEALEALLSGMQEYKGMMDRTANETVSGLLSQIEDTFEINIFRRWGQGLQDGAKTAFGSLVTLLNEADGALTSLGDTIYEVGKQISSWLAEKLENAVSRITEITSSFEFKEASLGEKISMLWNGVIVDPLKEWWESGGRQKTAETAGKIGSWIGEMLTKGLLALFGATDILNDGVGTEAGSSIAGSFLQGFLDNFDGSAITQAFVDAISNVWGALPWWAKMLIGGYGVGKAAGGIASFAGGLVNFVGGAKNAIGSFNIASSAFPILTSSGSGILGALGKTGVALGASTTGGALLAGTAGIAGGVAAGASIIKGGIDLYQAYQAHRAGDRTESQANLASGGSAIGGVAVGAAIGSIFGPLGTLVGAGLGGVAGWIGGEKWAANIRAARFESEEMQAAVADTEASSEEIAEAFAKAKWENAKKHFGDIKLSMEEIERLADQLVWGDDLALYDKFTSSVNAAEAALQSLNEAGEQTDRWMWKAGLGVKFNDDEIESIKTSFDEYIASAKSYVENKHYEFTAAVSLLVDIESEEGKSILESGNAFYGGLQEQLDSLGAELSETVEIALEDGVITLDEQQEIINLQQQIAEILEKVANAEQNAELTLIKLKFGGGNMDYESFESFMSQMQTTIDERMAANDEAFTAAVSSLNLQLADGAITQEEYDKQLQTLVDGYTGTVEKLQAEVKDVELQIIGEAYAEELGEDAVADLEKALQYAIDNGIDPVTLTDEKLAELLNIEVDGNGELLGNIKDMLSGVLGQLELLEIDGDLLLKVGEVETDGSVSDIVEGELPDSVEGTVDVEITGEKFVEDTITVLTEDFGIPEELSTTIAMLLSGDKEIINQIDTFNLAREFGVPESQVNTIIEKLIAEKDPVNRLNILAKDFGISNMYVANLLWQLTGDPEFMNTISVSGSDFGIPTRLSQSITFDITANRGSFYNNTGVPLKQFRGGIVGGPSAMGSFARGGIAGFSDGGMVRGGSQLIEVAEEGSPEMIIPLSSQRRGRALKLWAQAGNIMGVPGFNRGGMTDGSADEGIRFHQYGSDESAGGQSVQVDVGGITVDIHVDATGNANISEAIKAQAGEIAETVAGIMADALGSQFENTPVRGGVA